MTTDNLPRIHWNVQELDELFNPRTVVVVGDKAAGGYRFLKANATVKGRIYSVQLDESEIPGILELGIPNYKSLYAIPEPIDLVIVAVPRAVAPSILDQAIQVGAGSVTFYTAGFAETGTEEGIRLQNLLTGMATGARMRVVGPNCLGLYNPRAGIRSALEQSLHEEGSVGFISQSGNFTNSFTLVGHAHGIKISKAASFGNGITIDSTDYLEYMGWDPQTEVIGMYVEGPKEPRRFFQVLKEVTARKPVVILKGGITELGARAAVSHTGSLAGEGVVWQAMFRQCGAIHVEGFEELLDAVKSLAYLPPSTGEGIGPVVTTGGRSVVVSDICAREGFQVRRLSEGTYEELSGFFSTIGGSYKNPLDMTPTSRDMGLTRRALDILGRDENIDGVVYELGLGQMGSNWQSRVEMLSEYREALGKPLLVVLSGGTQEKEVVDLREALQEHHVAVYPSFHRALRAYRHLVNYYTFRQGVEAEA